VIDAFAVVDCCGTPAAPFFAKDLGAAPTRTSKKAAEDEMWTRSRRLRRYRSTTLVAIEVYALRGVRDMHTLYRRGFDAMARKMITTLRQGLK
jgi:hypothetical protein